MAELEAGEFAVSKQGETMHVIGKVARLNWHCADRGGTLKKWGTLLFSLKLIELNLAKKPRGAPRQRIAPMLRVNAARYFASLVWKTISCQSRNDGNGHTEQLSKHGKQKGRCRRHEDKQCKQSHLGLGERCNVPHDAANRSIRRRKRRNVERPFLGRAGAACRPGHRPIERHACHAARSS